MAEEIDFENGRNSNFEGLVTLTLTFDPAIRHIVVQQSSTSTYIPNFIQIEETFCGRTDVRTDGRTGGRTFFPSILLGRLSEVDLKTKKIAYNESEWFLLLYYVQLNKENKDLSNDWLSRTRARMTIPDNTAVQTLHQRRLQGGPRSHGTPNRLLSPFGWSNTALSYRDSDDSGLNLSVQCSNQIKSNCFSSLYS